MLKFGKLKISYPSKSTYLVSINVCGKFTLIHQIHYVYAAHHVMCVHMFMRCNFTVDKICCLATYTPEILYNFKSHTSSSPAVEYCCI